MEPEEKTEEQLAAELEDMYRRVASIEKPAGADDQDEEIPVRPSLEEPEPAWMPAGVEEMPGRHATTISSAAPPPLPQGRRRIFSGALAAGLVCIFMLLYGIFFWPTLYDGSSIMTGGKTYPVRINRITGKVAYFDGQQWRNTPLPALKPPIMPATPAPVVAEPAPVVPAPAAPPAAHTSTPSQKNVLPESRQVQAPAEFQAQTRTASADRLKRAPPGKTAHDRPFAIQVKSFDNAAEARKMVADLKKAGMEAESVAATVGARGIWNRVLIGRFNDPNEALEFMRENKIKDAYPDSFIQKRFP